jgi:hypothetical protein
VAIVGRQSGKSEIAAALAVFEAISAPREPGRGERYAVLVAQDQRGSLRGLFRYASQPFEPEISPMLARTVVGRTADTIQLENGVTIACYPCRPPFGGRPGKLAVSRGRGVAQTPGLVSVEYVSPVYLLASG